MSTFYGIVPFGNYTVTFCQYIVKNVVNERKSQISSNFSELLSLEKEVLDRLKNCPGLVANTSVLTSTR